MGRVVEPESRRLPLPNPASFPRTLLAFGLFVVTSTLNPAQSGAKPLPTAPQQGFQRLLKATVKDGLVDYLGIQATHKEALDAYLKALAEVTLPNDRNQRLGLLIDAYNALVIRSVIDEGRPRSVLDVKGFFDQKKHRFAGREVTLDHLEKGIINPYAKDPRTHFVLVCGAVGCPILDPLPYFGSKVDERMEAAARRYLRSPRGALVEVGVIRLSKLFDWYAADFGGPAGVLEFARKRLAEPDATRLGKSTKVEFLDYNWTLNQR
jgi:hypothetical protein